LQLCAFFVQQARAAAKHVATVVGRKLTPRERRMYFQLALTGK
jgi:hypothetical protein